MLVSRTPFRFSLIGGGSDLPAYYENYGPSKIISMTLQASMYVTYSKRSIYSDHSVYDSPIRLSYTRTENVDRIEDLQHDLVRGVLEDARDIWVTNLGSFEMTTIADIPSKGSGLGSSSALIVGILKVLHPQWSKYSLAAEAYAIETRTLGKNIGFQDHFSAAFGGLRRYGTLYNSVGKSIQFSGCHSQRGRDLARHLCAFRLSINRSMDAATLPVHQTLDEMKSDMGNRSFYIRETVDMVDKMWDELGKRNFQNVGNMLGYAWELKQASHGILDENLDRLYNLGIEAGALAGKVSGSMSGGAGHLFFLAYPDDHERIAQALSELVEMRVGYYPHGVTVTEI